MLGNLIRIGALVGAGYAAAKIGDKVKENSDDTPKTAEEKFTAVKAAAGEFAAETVEKINEKAPGVKSAVESAVQKVSDFVAEKAPVAEAKVQEMVEKVAEKAPGLVDTVNRVVEKVVEKTAPVADDVDEEPEILDADFEAVVEETEKAAAEEQPENAEE